MQPNEYQKLAARTQCDYSTLPNMLTLMKKPKADDTVHARKLVHGIIGLTGEVGELNTALEHWLFYSKERDDGNIMEEIGDCMWYIAQMCSALDVELEGIMRANIAKLKNRFPEKFTNEDALEHNRDRQAERDIIEDEMQKESAGEENAKDYLMARVVIQTRHNDHLLPLTNAQARILIREVTFVCPKCKNPINEDVAIRGLTEKLESILSRTTSTEPGPHPPTKHPVGCSDCNTDFEIWEAICRE